MVKLEGMFGSFGPTKLLPVQLGGLCGRLLILKKYPISWLFKIFKFLKFHSHMVSIYQKFSDFWDSSGIKFWEWPINQVIIFFF
jgi:hypothetical protein